MNLPIKINPGISWGNLISIVVELVILIVFLVYMRTDINQNRVAIENHEELLKSNGSVLQEVSITHSGMLERLKLAEADIAANKNTAERLGRIETSLDFIAKAISDIKNDNKLQHNKK